MSATTSTPSSAAIASALAMLNAAIVKLQQSPASTVPANPPTKDFKLFELKLAIDILNSLSSPMTTKWHCSSGPALILSHRPNELAAATTFSIPGAPMALALNVNVHYHGSPWRGARHEADLAIFDSSQVARPNLDHRFVWQIVEAKYRPTIPKSVLRELAFVASQLPVLTFQFIFNKELFLAVPDGPWKTARLPAYWGRARSDYGVTVKVVQFP